MTLRIALPSLLLLFLTVLPAAADTVYDNGPINGNNYAWQIDLGQVTSDTFTVGAGGATITGLSFGAWLYPGDILFNVTVSITSDEFGGTTYFDQFVDVTQSHCVVNQYGFNVCIETVSFSPVNLAPGTYWLNLQNATYGGDSPVYWDENEGPSQASQNSVGTVPSEAFTLTGTPGSTTTTTSTTGTVPEPSSVMLFGSSILGLAGWLRRTR